MLPFQILFFVRLWVQTDSQSLTSISLTHAEHVQLERLTWWVWLAQQGQLKRLAWWVWLAQQGQLEWLAWWVSLPNRCSLNGLYDGCDLPNMCSLNTTLRTRTDWATATGSSGLQPWELHVWNLSTLSVVFPPLNRSLLLSAFRAIKFWTTILWIYRNFY